jgi:hypothetical protein
VHVVGVAEDDLGAGSAHFVAAERAAPTGMKAGVRTRGGEGSRRAPGLGGLEKTMLDRIASP